MSGNDLIYSSDFCDSFQLTNWILDSRKMCYTEPQVSDFIPGSLEDMNKYIEVEDAHYFTVKQRGKIKIKLCDDNRNNFIVTLHIILLAPYLCNRLYLITTLMK